MLMWGCDLTMSVNFPCLRPLGWCHWRIARTYCGHPPALAALAWLTAEKIEEWCNHKKDPKIKAPATLTSNQVRKLVPSRVENDAIVVSTCVHSEYKSAWYEVKLVVPTAEGHIQTKCVCKRAYVRCKFLKFEFSVLTTPADRYCAFIQSPWCMP